MVSEIFTNPIQKVSKYLTILTFMSFSPVAPGSTLSAFCFVLLITMVKDAIKDYSRFSSDLIANCTKIQKFTKNNWRDNKSASIKPGDIVKLFKDEEAWADIMLICSSNSNGICNIDTKN